MKRKLFFSFLSMVLAFSLYISFSFGIDCSMYDETISQLKTNLRQLEQARQSAMASSNAYATKYNTQIAYIQQLIFENEVRKAECLENNSYSNSYNSYGSVNYVQYVEDGLDYIESGLTAASNKNYSQAINNFKKGVSSLETALNYFTDTASRTRIKDSLQLGYEGLGISYCVDKQYDNAFTYFERALDIGYKSDIQDAYDMCKSESKRASMTRDERCQDSYGINAKAASTEGKCTCKNGYTWNSSKTSCVAQTFSCSNYYGPNSYLGADNLCYCKDGYGWDTPDKTYCVAIDQSCKGWYGENVYVGADDLCYCKAGYQWNDSMTSCIKSQTTTITNTTKKYFTDYKLDAYNFAFANGITTMDSIDKADMYGTLDRIAMAKMVGNYAINILGLIPDTTQSCYFPDVASSLNEQYDNGVTKACQLGLMGQGITKFRPWDKVTRAEFATVLSRLINRDSADLYSMNSAVPYFSKHMEYLRNNGIIDSVVNLSEYDNEIRGYVMLMLMRSANTYDDVYDYYDSISELFFDCFDIYEEVLTGDDFSVKDVKNVLNVCKISDDKISKFVSWNGDQTLVVGYGYYIHSMVNLLETMYNYMLDPTDTKEEEMFAAAEYLDDEAYDKFVQADEDFIEKFGLVFDED